MRPSFDTHRGLQVSLCAGLLAAMLALLPATGHTQAQLPDDDAMDTAAELQLQGHPWRAEALLRRLAEAGHVLAMERLALLHWYGQRLYPGQPWDQDLARLWFARAAAQGSELGRHMLRLNKRQAASAPAG